jgi:hypothetical protein
MYKVDGGDSNRVVQSADPPIRILRSIFRVRGGTPAKTNTPQQKSSTTAIKGNIMPPTLCKSCAGITLDALCEPDGYQHLPNAQTIFESAVQCPFCDLIRKGMMQNTSAGEGTIQNRDRDFITAQPITLHGVSARSSLGLDSETSIPKATGIVGPRLLVGIDAYIPLENDDLDIINLSLFAKPGFNPSPPTPSLMSED